MRQDLPHGPHTAEYRDATRLFLERFAPDTSCHLTFRGFFDRFAEAEHPSTIGVMARRRPGEVLEIYNKIFKPCFGDYEYDQWRSVCARQQFLRDLPTDPVIRFFVQEGLLAGHHIETLNRQHRSGARYVCRRQVLFNQGICRIHRFERRTATYIDCHGLEDATWVGAVVMSPQPTYGVVIPATVLSNLRRARHGTHVRVNLCHNYPGEIRFGAVA